VSLEHRAAQGDEVSIKRLKNLQILDETEDPEERLELLQQRRDAERLAMLAKNIQPFRDPMVWLTAGRRP
jgi:hypothetical protein